MSFADAREEFYGKEKGYFLFTKTAPPRLPYTGNLTGN
jgi:hypothetical protein